MASRSDLEADVSLIASEVGQPAIAWQLGMTPTGAWAIYGEENGEEKRVCDLGDTKGEAAKTLLRLGQFVASLQRSHYSCIE